MAALHDQLQIVVFTYNRAERLSRTLAQLHDSPFRACRLTVLDNASTDDTPGVCATWSRRFAAMGTIRHRLNLGLGGNYLRAVETSEREYTWILSDDEAFDFSDCEDVIDAIEEGEVDLISLGSPGRAAWERGLRTTTKGLVGRGSRYFFVFTFVAGVIFRTSQFDSQCVAAGYRNIHNLYPQYEHIYQSLVEDRQVLTSRREIVHRTSANRLETTRSSLYWLTCWARAAQRIEDPLLRRKTIYFDTPAELVRHLVFGALVERLEHPDVFGEMIVDLARSFSWDQRLLLVLFIGPIIAVPRPVLYAARRLYRAWRREPLADVAGGFDPLRL